MVQNVHSSYVSTHKPRLEVSMQRGASDNYLVRGGNGSLGEGSARNSETSMKRGEALCRLRHVSELRPYLRSLRDSTQTDFSS